LYSEKDEKAWDDLIKEADLNGDGEVILYCLREIVNFQKNRLITTNS